MRTVAAVVALGLALSGCLTSSDSNNETGDAEADPPILPATSEATDCKEFIAFWSVPKERIQPYIPDGYTLVPTDAALSGNPTGQADVVLALYECDFERGFKEIIGGVAVAVTVDAHPESGAVSLNLESWSTREDVRSALEARDIRAIEPEIHIDWQTDPPARATVEANLDGQALVSLTAETPAEAPNELPPPANQYWYGTESGRITTFHEYHAFNVQTSLGTLTECSIAESTLLHEFVPSNECLTAEYLAGFNHEHGWTDHWVEGHAWVEDHFSDG